MYWSISRPGDVWMLVLSGSGNETARGVCPGGSTCGVEAIGVTRLSGTSDRFCGGFLLEPFGLGAFMGGGPSG